MIWKFNLPEYIGASVIYNESFVDFLNISQMDGYVSFWAIIDENKPKRRIKFLCCPTGTQFAAVDEMEHLGSVTDAEGKMWHYFWEQL